jgi:hypothetical protein
MNLHDQLKHLIVQHGLGNMVYQLKCAAVDLKTETPEAITEEMIAELQAVSQTCYN